VRAISKFFMSVDLQAITKRHRRFLAIMVAIIGGFKAEFNGSVILPWLGYRVDVMVDAKNSFGGYVGAKKYTFWFRDNQLLTISVPNDEA
jgi:hypothetical protein